MTRPFCARSWLALFFCGAFAPTALPPLTAQAAVTVAAPAVVPATPENAAAFIGDWTLAANGPNGPSSFALTVKNAEGKVVGEISAEMMPRQVIEDISKSDAALRLYFTFDYQGTPVPVVVTLTPADGKIGAVLDFADGAYVMNGAATRAVAKPSE